MDDDEIDEDTYEELTAKVVQCREDLQKFLAMRLKKKSGLAAFRDQYLPGFDPVEIAIGGSDGLAMKYTMASCDKNGDGKIKADELEKLQESSANILSAQTEAQMNAGVVAALILSFMVPLSLEPIEASDDCADFFGQDAVKYLRIVHYAVIIVVEESYLDLPVVLKAVHFIDCVNNLPRDRVAYAVSCTNNAVRLKYFYCVFDSFSCCVIKNLFFDVVMEFVLSL